MAFAMGLTAAEEAALVGRGIMSRGLTRFLGSRELGMAGRAISRVGRYVRRNPITSGLLAAQAGELARRPLRRLTRKRKTVGAVRKAGTRRMGPAKKARRTVLPKFRPTGAVRATIGRKFRKGAKPVTGAKFTKRHYDDYGIFTRDHAMYFGMQTHGSQQRLCRIYGEALTRYLLSTVGIRPTSYDEICVADAAGTDNDLIKNFALHMKSIDDTTGADTLAYNTFNLTGATFESVATAVGDFINQQLDNGQYPNKAYFYKTYGSNDILHSIVEDMEYGKVTIIAKQIIRLQNLTPNDAGGTALDATGTNPIQGKIYDFTSQPLLRSGLQETHADLDTFQSHAETTTGYYALPNSGSTASGGILGHPPNAGDLFKNCRKVANVRIDAGANKFKTTTFRFTGNLVDFVKRFNYGHNERNLGGGITWFGFEQMFRSGADQVKVAFNRELSMSAYYARPKKQPMLKHYEQTDLGDAL